MRGLLLMGLLIAGCPTAPSQDPPNPKVTPGAKASGTAPATPPGAAPAGGAHAAGAPRDAAATGNASAILKLILEDNEEFASRHPASYFARFQSTQHPRVTVIGCSDSRFHMQALDHAPDDDVFVIRNIGNNVHATAGSIDYGIRHLHTPVLLVVGHVGCGAVKAAMGDYDSESAVIQRELDALHLSLFRTAAVGTFQQRWLANVLGNVHQQVRYAVHDYRELVDAGALYVVGAVYDFRNELGAGYGKLHIVNINGERDEENFRASPVLAAVSTSPPATAPAAP